MTTVFGHPGRRFGQLVEALTLLILGSSLGLAWSILGLYLSSLIISHDQSSAYTVKAIFLVVAAMTHGFLRSYAPRLFPGLILLISVAAITLLSTAKQVTQVAATQILYPILTASGVILVVNLLVFPEFSSSFLGQVTIETLDDTAKALENAGGYFLHVKEGKKDSKEGDASDAHGSKGYLKRENISRLVNSQSDGPRTGRPSIHRDDSNPVGQKSARRITSAAGQGAQDTARQKDADVMVAETTESSPVLTLSELSSFKGFLRQKLTTCKGAQNECNFEVAFAVLPPRDLKSISSRLMAKLLANTVAIIGTCESKFALVGDSVDSSSAEEREDIENEVREQDLDDEGMTRAELKMIKPRREIEFGDVRLLQFLLRRLKEPYRNMSQVVFETVRLIITCVAHTYVSAYSFKERGVLTHHRRTFPSFLQGQKRQSTLRLRS